MDRRKFLKIMGAAGVVSALPLNTAMPIRWRGCFSRGWAFATSCGQARPGASPFSST